MFANRLAKKAKHLRKWAKREGIACYRLYDQDIPEVPLVVDWYEGAVVLGDRRMHDDEGHRRGGDGWVDAMVAQCVAQLGVSEADVFVKGRKRLIDRQQGVQYERYDESGEERLVHEGGLAFWINLSDYLDTGLFLDHRVTRSLVKAEQFEAAQAARRPVRMLNLFCYTGAFSVHAAAAGMRTTSVDMSRTYVEWAERNFAANQLDVAGHEFVQSDVRTFLREAKAARARYELAVVDPPTFSNSKRMDYTWDVQRDHAALLTDVASVMAPGGVIWFSTNRRRFQLDSAGLGWAQIIEDRTAQTVPPDFRDQKVHRAYRLTMP